MPGAMNSCPKNETGCLAFGIALWMERVASGQGAATFPGHVPVSYTHLNLPKLGIGKEHYEAIEKAVKDLGRQGLAIEIIKE